MTRPQPQPDPASAPRKSLIDATARFVDPSLGRDPSCYDPDAMAAAMARIGRFFGPRGRYFRVSSSGWDNVPASPTLVVANHSGGTSIPDAWGLGWAWYDRFGFDRPAHPMAHDMVFSTPLTAGPFARLGILRADRAIAHDVLTRYRRDIVVMPGGDVETWRPRRDEFKLVWSNRVGYARTALRAGVPVVPIACAGAHAGLWVVSDGRRLAQRLGLPRLARAEIFPVHLSFPWGLAVGPLPHLPPPAHFRYLVGSAIDPPMYVAPGDEPPARAVHELDTRVRGELQSLLARLERGELGSG